MRLSKRNPEPTRFGIGSNPPSCLFTIPDGLDIPKLTPVIAGSPLSSFSLKTLLRPASVRWPCVLRRYRPERFHRNISSIGRTGVACISWIPAVFEASKVILCVDRLLFDFQQLVFTSRSVNRYCAIHSLAAAAFASSRQLPMFPASLLLSILLSPIPFSFPERLQYLMECQLG